MNKVMASLIIMKFQKRITVMGAQYIQRASKSEAKEAKNNWLVLLEQNEAMLYIAKNLDNLFFDPQLVSHMLFDPRLAFLTRQLFWCLS